jgi:predicted amidohydrolase
VFFVKAAILQMQVALGEPEKNIDNLYRMAAQAMEQRPDVLLLPELWRLGFYPRPVLSYADADGRQTREALAAIAQKYQVNVVGGTVANAIGDKVFNTSYIFDRLGHLVSTYHKTHLFSPSGESADFIPGDNLVTFTLDGIKCGILVCYDVRFPEAARALSLAGISVLFIPAAWPLKRLIHWQTLIRSRAIENQLFIVACNASGTDGSDQKLAGHSAIIDPWGEILAEANEEETILQGNLRLAIQAQIKESMNVFGDRRPKLYEKSSH